MVSLDTGKNYTDKRDELQKDGSSSLLKVKKGLLEWGTGTGKTRAALLTIREVPGAWHIIVPRITLIKGWLDDAKKFGFTDIVDRYDSGEIKIYCYNSLGKYGYGGNLCMDEVHRAKSDIRSSEIIEFKPEYLIALSATVDDDVYTLLQSMGVRHKWEIPLTTGIAWGIIAKPKIIVLKCNPSDVTDLLLKHTFKKGKGVREVIKVKDRWEAYKKLKQYSSVEIEFHCSVADKIDIVNYGFDSASSRYDTVQNKPRATAREIASAKRGMLSKAIERKRTLGECKLTILQRLCNICKGKRTVVYAPSKRVCRWLGNEDNQFHQDNSKGLDNFNEGIVDHLFVVDKITEGENIYNCNIGILSQLGSKEIDEDIETTQRLGRILRGDKPVIFVIVFEGTKDETYLDRKIDMFKSIGEYVEYDYSILNHWEKLVSNG
jgi:superfamily II DNA or RNA helicase